MSGRGGYFGSRSCVIAREKTDELSPKNKNPKATKDLPGSPGMPSFSPRELVDICKLQCTKSKKYPFA